MGQYAQFFIGKLYLRWKDYVPTFLTFLFDEEDFYATADEDGYQEEIGYRATSSECIAVLERYGYSLEFFAEVYGFFYDDLYDAYRYFAEEQISMDHASELRAEECHKRFLEHVNAFPSTSRSAEQRDFVKFLGVLLRTDFKSPPFDDPYRLKLQDGREYSVDSEEYLRARRFPDADAIDFEAFQTYVLRKIGQFPPWILMLCDLFGEGYLLEYPEIISLMFVRLALEAVGPDTEVRLDLADIAGMEGPEEGERMVRGLHADLAHSLIQKVRLYNRVFQTLFVNEDDIRTRYIKTQCADILQECVRGTSKPAKGRALEHLTEILFTSNNSLDMVDKRVSTGDEEIDLVIKNNIDRPFWLAFQSPLFFVECKNWNDPVGARELRDFEMKLQNHSALAKVGFFVAVNGFTAGVREELKRAGREQYHIVLIDRGDIEDYVSSDVDFFVWLEGRASKFH